jgi:hypothetical protein
MITTPTLNSSGLIMDTTNRVMNTAYELFPRRPGDGQHRLFSVLRPERSVFGGLVFPAICLCLGFARFSADEARAETYVWKGGTDLRWETAQNWEPGAVPGWDVTGADVVVQMENDVIQVSVPLTLGNLVTETKVRFWGAIVVANQARVTDLIFHNGSFSVEDVVFSGDTVWNGGLLQGSPGSPALNTGTLGLYAGIGHHDKILWRKVFVNQGTVDHWGGTFGVSADAEVRNEGDWNFHGSGGTGFDNGTRALGGAIFKNRGTLRRYPGTPPGTPVGSSINIPFDNEDQGRVSVTGPNAGILFWDGGRVGGSYNVADGGVIEFAPRNPAAIFEVQSEAQFSGVGEVRVGGSAATPVFRVRAGGGLNANVAPGAGLGFHLAANAPTRIDGFLRNRGTMRWSWGSLAGTGQIENSGLFLVAGGTPLQMKFVNQNGGAVYQTGNLFMDNGVEVENQPGSIWELQDGHILAAHESNESRFTVKGRLLRGRPDGTTSATQLVVGIPLRLEGEGAIECHEPASLSFQGGGLLESGSFIGSGRIELNGPQGLERAIYSVAGVVEANILTSTAVPQFIIGPYAEVRMLGGILWNDGLATVQGVVSSGSGEGGELINSYLMGLSGALIGTETSYGIVRNRDTAFMEAVTVYGKYVNARVTHQRSWVRLPGGVIENPGGYVLTAGGLIDAPLDKMGRFENMGILSLVAGLATVTRGVIFDNEGGVEIRDGSLTIENCAQVVGQVLTGGEWMIHALGRLQLGNGIVMLGSGARVSVAGSAWSGFAPSELEKRSNLRVSSSVLEVPSVKNKGEIKIDPEATLKSSGEVNNSGGKIEVQGHLESAGPIHNNPDDEGDESILEEIPWVFVPASIGDPAGSGSGMAKLNINTPAHPVGRHESAPIRPMITTPVLNNSGLIRPGGPDRAGPFNLTGDLVQTIQGRIQIELGGATPLTQHDQVRIYNGSATLAGTLEVKRIDGFEPQPGQQFVIIFLSDANAGISGAFDSVIAPEGLGLSVSYVEDRVVLTVESFSVPAFCVRRDGTELEIHWSAGVLETSSAVTGPWSPAPGATSPFRLVPDEPQRYFRVR